MDIKLLNLTYELKSLIDTDERFIKLDELDKKINNDDEVISLAYKMDIKSVALSDCLKIYSENDEHVINARKELYEAKKNLDSHPLVKEYNKAYSEVRLLLNEVNKVIFDEFNSNTCPSKK